MSFLFECGRDGCFGSVSKEHKVSILLPRPSLLIVGSGAREHAIASIARKSRQNPRLSCFGSNVNPGIRQICKASGGVHSFKNDITDPAEVCKFVLAVREAAEHKSPTSQGADGEGLQLLHEVLVVIGPEAPLEAGVVDALEEMAEVSVIGPTKALAQLETSKAFTRKLMEQHLIPGRVKHQEFHSIEGAEDFINSLGGDYVVKADGLCGGKGVQVSGDHIESIADGLQYCEQLLSTGGSFVIEQKLVGEEFSVMSFCDGDHLAHMPPVQDHKRAFEGDTGPNTGGMGAYSGPNGTLPFLVQADVDAAQTINQKIAEALREQENYGYKGVLYGQFMATATGVSVIEYNARFGDPEALNLLSVLDDEQSDLIAIFNAIAQGTLSQDMVKFKPLATVCKYAVPVGYPAAPVKGQKIDVSKVAEHDLLYLASVDQEEDGTLVECGSRTAAFVGLGSSLEEAEKTAQAEIERLIGPLRHRKDIGTAAAIDARVQHMKQLRGMHVGILGNSGGSFVSDVAADAIKHGASVRVVITDTNDGPPNPKEKCLDVEYVPIDANWYSGKQDLESEISRLFQTHGVELVLINGWPHQLSDGFKESWQGRCFALAPAPVAPGSAGLQRAGQLLRAGQPVEYRIGELGSAGNGVPECTRVCEIEKGDTPKSLLLKLQTHQHEAFSKLVQMFANGQMDTIDTGMTYSAAGVSIDAGNQLVDRIKPLCKATTQPGCLGNGIGGFGGLFDPKAAGFKDPILVACTDGVGTKLKLAHMAQQHGTVGIDLVAMSVNDLVVQGAQPLFFLDYFACGKLDVNAAVQVVEGISRACQESSCALIGGETAEMPSMYPAGEYDLAGFAVGAVERGQMLPKMELIKEGDVLLGLASSGVHSNGFSLVRRIVEAIPSVDSRSVQNPETGLSEELTQSSIWTEPCPWSEGQTLLDAFLTPTALYVRPCLDAISSGKVKALCHITGGGLLENLPRVLPPNLVAQLQLDSYELPEVFKWLMMTGNVANEEMLRTFNCGVGMVIICDPADVDDIEQKLGEGRAIRLGHLEAIDDGNAVRVNDDGNAVRVKVTEWWD